MGGQGSGIYERPSKTIAVIVDRFGVKREQVRIRLKCEATPFDGELFTSDVGADRFLESFASLAVVVKDERARSRSR